MTRTDGPVEVTLSKPNLAITCRIMREDRTVTEVAVHSLSMRGAQRSVTTWLSSQGYIPAGRWETRETSSVRLFR